MKKYVTMEDLILFEADSLTSANNLQLWALESDSSLIVKYDKKGRFLGGFLIVSTKDIRK